MNRKFLSLVLLLAILIFPTSIMAEEENPNIIMTPIDNYNTPMESNALNAQEANIPNIIMRSSQQVLMDENTGSVYNFGKTLSCDVGTNNLNRVHLNIYIKNTGNSDIRFLVRGRERITEVSVPVHSDRVITLNASDLKTSIMYDPSGVGMISVYVNCDNSQSTRISAYLRAVYYID